MATRRRTRWVLAGLGLVAVALVAWVVFHKKPAKAGPPPAIPVNAVKASIQDLPVSITALGAAQAWTSDTVFSQVSGKLLRVNFREGARVRAGQVLAEVDPAPYRAALMQAEGALKRDQAILANARLDLTRYRRLEQLDSIARQTVDTQAATVKQDEGIVLIDQGQVAAAKVNLGWCRITSPVSGRAGVRLVDAGNLVSAGGSVGNTPVTSAAVGATGSGGASGSGGGAGGSGIVVINQLQPIAVTFTVPEGDFERLSQLSDGFRRPLPAQAHSQETGELLGVGQLEIADNRVEAATGTVSLKARFPNADERLWPGQFVNVQVTTQTLRNAVVIPASAVNHGPNGSFVFVVGPGNKVAVRPVVIALTQGATAVVRKGVSAGEVVVTDGQMTLKAGSQIRVASAAPARRPAS